MGLPISEKRLRIAARTLSYLTLEGARGDALAEQLEAVHFGLDQAASVIAAPFLPDGAAKPLVFLD